ncbi:MAG: response regulator receiver protein [Candidatus Moranbacteria bacterium GW2011_GWE1_36_7]|nr:MAG: response regulator receiver protein [Candidatus Moranbacteria bacterium GW2011_GWD2_36_12]KKQ06440.1 MAG: response regulator receiver protein [Candidatus Moranbacteria bacterium GW2011_GWE2_36_40]KKQ15490.1 MAG: response regulator receiver protein [Candidatus Moranbacteria bacterium GW2011_GWE1_36_7]
MIKPLIRRINSWWLKKTSLSKCIIAIICAVSLSKIFEETHQMVQMKLSETIAEWIMLTIGITVLLLVSYFLTVALQSKERLRNISNYDTLTELHSRHYLEENTPRIIAEARRHEWYVWAIMLDLNKFKPINDRFGHHEGDRLLQYFARQLLDAIRDTDLCVRLGGDEVVIIGSDPNYDAVSSLVERILKDMGAWSMEIGGVTIKMTAAIGFSTKKLTKGSNISLEEIIREADNEMYKNKKISQQTTA